MDWGVVADANQEVWLGDGLKVARRGLLAYRCGCFFVGFCFVLVGSNVSIPFCWYMHVLVHARSALQRMARFSYFTSFFFSIRSLSRSFECLPPPPPPPHQRPTQSAEGGTGDSSSLSPAGQTFICLPCSISGPHRDGGTEPTRMSQGSRQQK